MRFDYYTTSHPVSPHSPYSTWTYSFIFKSSLILFSHSINFQRKK